MPAYAVLNATNFARCCAHIGDRIELDRPRPARRTRRFARPRPRVAARGIRGCARGHGPAVDLARRLWIGSGRHACGTRAGPVAERDRAGRPHSDGNQRGSAVQERFDRDHRAVAAAAAHGGRSIASALGQGPAESARSRYLGHDRYRSGIPAVVSPPSPQSPDATIVRRCSASDADGSGRAGPPRSQSGRSPQSRSRASRAGRARVTPMTPVTPITDGPRDRARRPNPGQLPHLPPLPCRRSPYSCARRPRPRRDAASGCRAAASRHATGTSRRCWSPRDAAKRAPPLRRPTLPPHAARRCDPVARGRKSKRNLRRSAARGQRRPRSTGQSSARCSIVAPDVAAKLRLPSVTWPRPPTAMSSARCSIARRIAARNSGRSTTALENHTGSCRARDAVQSISIPPA